jgi:hypothetical protein
MTSLQSADIIDITMTANNHYLRVLSGSMKRKWQGCFLTPLLVCLTVGLSFATTRQPLTQQLDALSEIRGKFSFAVIGDTRSGGDDYSRLIRGIMEHRPDFIVNTGDMVRSSRKVFWDDFGSDRDPLRSRISLPQATMM